MAKDWKERLGVVYSTSDSFDYDSSQDSTENEEVEPQKQLLYISHDKKQRKGKIVTLIEGFKGSQDNLEALSKIVKQRCGVGGTAKDGEIIIQGQLREKVQIILDSLGYKTKFKGG
ncbi:MAG: translation initiation factor [Bacteroidales bacterium]|nr:translation initiation factor [Bacteroidales bacterium]